MKDRREKLVGNRLFPPEKLHEGTPRHRRNCTKSSYHVIDSVRDLVLNETLHWTETAAVKRDWGLPICEVLRRDRYPEKWRRGAP